MKAVGAARLRCLTSMRPRDRVKPDKSDSHDPRVPDARQTHAHHRCPTSCFKVRLPLRPPWVFLLRHDYVALFGGCFIIRGLSPRVGRINDKLQELINHTSAPYVDYFRRSSADTKL